MRKKHFFFDIDGTLAEKGGTILPSTHATLKALRANGHFIAIATGRAYGRAIEFSKLVDIENLVTDGGNGLVLNGKLVVLKPLDKKVALQIIHECIKKDIPFCITIDNTINLYSHSASFDTRDCWGGFKNHHGPFIVDESLNYDEIPEIFKIFIGLREEEEATIATIHGELAYMRYHPEHIIIEEIDKYKGIRKMMQYLEAPLEDVVVFGDGKNDLSMVQQAGIGIAMGNADNELKKKATFVTKSNDEDGIEYACKHFNWI
jgi:HAD-superfamily hydrolase, subfamily IIB